MLTLDNLKNLRIHRGLGRHHLATATGIDPKRLRELEIQNEAEPWYDEAVILARTLGAPGICTLTLSGNLTLWPVGVFRDDDLFVWRSDWRKPLSVAARVAKHWGVADPYDLAMPPLQLQRQLWEVLSASERHPEAPGWCTWCRADIVSGEPHADHCLPNNLYATHVPGVFSRPLLPKPARRGMRTPGIKAYGIKKLREGREWRQQDVAQRLGIDTNYFARIERADLALTNAKAKQIAELFDVHVDEVYGHEPDRPDPT